MGAATGKTAWVSVAQRFLNMTGTHSIEAGVGVISTGRLRKGIMHIFSQLRREALQTLRKR